MASVPRVSREPRAFAHEIRACVLVVSVQRGVVAVIKLVLARVIQAKVLF